MTDLRKAAEMALEFVEWLCGDDHSVKPKNNALKTREALRQALAQPDEVLAEREACAKGTMCLAPEHGKGLPKQSEQGQRNHQSRPTAEASLTTAPPTLMSMP